MAFKLTVDRVDAIIFDMDGLLLDTERIYARAFMAAARAVGLEMSEGFCHSMIGIPGKDCDILIQNHLGSDFPLADYLRECRSQVLEEYVQIRVDIVQSGHSLAELSMLFLTDVDVASGHLSVPA